MGGNEPDVRGVRQIIIYRTFARIKSWSLKALALTESLAISPSVLSPITRYARAKTMFTSPLTI